MESNVRASLAELLCMGLVGEAGAFSQSQVPTKPKPIEVAPSLILYKFGLP
jgi:hypothetical protein